MDFYLLFYLVLDNQATLNIRYPFNFVFKILEFNLYTFIVMIYILQSSLILSCAPLVSPPPSRNVNPTCKLRIHRILDKSIVLGMCRSYHLVAWYAWSQKCRQILYQHRTQCHTSVVGRQTKLHRGLIKSSTHQYQWQIKIIVNELITIFLCIFPLTLLYIT